MWEGVKTNNFDSKLTFNEQLDYVLGWTNRIWGFVFPNTMSFKNPESIKYWYVTLIKSILMYASTIWRPIVKINMDRLERIQHKSIGHLAFLSGNHLLRFDRDYASTAETFGLPSVSSSQIASDVLFLYKIKCNRVKCSELHNLFLIHSSNYMYIKKQITILSGDTLQ